MQLSVRLDAKRRMLVYDCYEFKPKAWSVYSGPLPSEREFLKAERTLDPSGGMGGGGGGGYYVESDEDSRVDDEDPSMDEPVQPRDPSKPFSKVMCIRVLMSRTLSIYFFGKRVEEKE
jgi:hypothetical protein